MFVFNAENYSGDAQLVNRQVHSSLVCMYLEELCDGPASCMRFLQAALCWKPGACFFIENWIACVSPARSSTAHSSALSGGTWSPLGCHLPSPAACTLTTTRWSCTTVAWTSGQGPSRFASGAPAGMRRGMSIDCLGGQSLDAFEPATRVFTSIALRCCSWYGPGDPKLCFIERKTHRESWKGGYALPGWQGEGWN